MPIPPPSLQPDTRARARCARRVAAQPAEGLVAGATAFARDRQLPEVVAILRHGDATAAIVSAAAGREADHVVPGSAGRSGPDRLLHPGVAAGMRRRAGRPVRVLHPGRAD